MYYIEFSILNVVFVLYVHSPSECTSKIAWIFGNTRKCKNTVNSGNTGKSKNTLKNENTVISRNIGKSGNALKISHLVDFWSCLNFNSRIRQHVTWCLWDDC